MSWLQGNYEITEAASRAYNAAKGAAGEQPADVAEMWADGLPDEPPCFTCDGIGCPDCLYDDTDRDARDDR